MADPGELGSQGGRGGGRRGRKDGYKNQPIPGENASEESESYAWRWKFLLKRKLV